MLAGNMLKISKRSGVNYSWHSLTIKSLTKANEGLRGRQFQGLEEIFIID